MSEFRTETDIGNRALQHCGAPRMDPAKGFTENSRGAGEIRACYGKLRQAELRHNVWTFACKRAMLRAVDDNTMLLSPALWVATSTYFVGHIVTDENGTLWISRIPNNLGSRPEVTNAAWEPYFGPLTVSLFASGQSYYAGELVYTTAGDGKARVYLSLQTGNADVPGTATAWSATGVYSKNDVVTRSSVAYMSLIDLNTNNDPASTPAAWNVGTTYALANTVAGSDGVIYTSLANGNLGHDPTLDGGLNWSTAGTLVPWTTSFVGGAGSNKWRQIGGTEFPSGVALTTLDIVYPLGTGPSTQTSTRNVYKLPAGYLRTAPQNPGNGVASWLGGPSGMTYLDWAFENGFLLSGDTGPIPFRFVADITDVSRMDPMFCEGLAARIGMSVCDTLTQSNAQLGVIAKVYTQWIADARAQNAIEQRAEDPPQDDFITCRL
jgi:hypothetical protein